MDQSDSALSPRKRLRSESHAVDQRDPDQKVQASHEPTSSTSVQVTDSALGLGLLSDVHHRAHTPTPDAPNTPNNLALNPPKRSDVITPTVTRDDASLRRDGSDDRANLPPTPNTAERPGASHLTSDRPDSGALEHDTRTNKPSLTNSAAETQEHPITLSAKTLRGLVELVRDVFSKHETTNWIAHSCLIAFELDQARRALQSDLYATDEAFLAGRQHEKILSERGLTQPRVDAFVTKVLKVLDGIAAAEEEPDAGADTDQNLESLRSSLDQELDKYPAETKEALESAGKLIEYLLRGKVLQEKKRLDIERRVKVLEGMVKVGEVVGGVVRFLLTEDR